MAILPGADYASACECAERFRKAIQNAPWPSRPITASFGIATFDGTSLSRDALDDNALSGNVAARLSPTALLASADKALYWSKTNGRNRTTHADDIR